MTNTTKEVRENQYKVMGQMSTSQITWYMVKRHKIFLLITSNILTFTLFVVVHFGPAYRNFIR